MPEYGMFPLWIKENDIDGFENISINEFSVSSSLKCKLDDWDNSFQNTFNEAYPPDSGFAHTEEASLFEEEGIKICKALQSEIGEFEIKYYSVVNHKLYEDI